MVKVCMATTATAMRCGWIRFVPLHLCTYICRDNIRGSCVHNSLPLCEGDYEYTDKSVLYFSLAIFCVRFIFFYPASLLLTISFALVVCVCACLYDVFVGIVLPFLYKSFSSLAYKVHRSWMCVTPQKSAHILYFTYVKWVRVRIRIIVQNIERLE